MTVKLIVRPASEFCETQREQFKKLVMCDPQVNAHGLSDRIANASYLAYLHLEGKLVGVNAIKNNRKYQRSLEARAGVELPNSHFLGEIGYLHVAKDYRRARLADVLLLATLAATKERGLFATIQSTNIGSRRLFERHGFNQVGKSWPSKEVKDQVNLYVRRGQK